MFFVSVGNLAFTMPFMPQSSKLHDSDIVGLVVIMAGLLLYRFTGGPSAAEEEDDSDHGNDENASTVGEDLLLDTEQPVQDMLRQPLLSGDI